MEKNAASQDRNLTKGERGAARFMKQAQATIEKPVSPYEEAAALKPLTWRQTAAFFATQQQEKEAAL